MTTKYHKKKIIFLLLHRIEKSRHSDDFMLAVQFYTSYSRGKDDERF